LILSFALSILCFFFFFFYLEMDFILHQGQVLRQNE